MKILYVASDNNYTSGAFLSMVTLAERLQCAGNEVFVALPNEGDGDILLKRRGIPYEIVPSRNWVVDILDEAGTRRLEAEKAAELPGNEIAIRRLAGIIRERNIEIVHINTSYSYVGAVAAARTRRPLIWHIREFLEEDQGRKIYARRAGYQLISSADAIVVTSRSLLSKYAKIFPKEKLRLIHNGIDAYTYPADAERQLFADREIQITILGGVLPYKGQEELIAACRILRERGITGWHCSIVGKCKSAYQEKIVEKIRQAGLASVVTLDGPAHDVPAVLHKTDILCVCSRCEAFGRVTVEGMFAGCLVIGADTAGTVEVLDRGKAGRLYAHGNPESLADQLALAMKDQEGSRSLALQGRKRACACFTAEKNAKAIYRLYQDILGMRKMYGED